jgi:hypothetical protein
VCFQLRTSSSSENMQSYKNENYWEEITMDSNF